MIVKTLQIHINVIFNVALPAGGGGPPSPGGGGGIPPLPDGAAVSPAMDAEFGRRIVLPGPPQVKPLAEFN